MSTPNPTSEYMMLFRGPHWDKGLSPEELQHRMNHVMGWFEDLKRRGKIKVGQPLGPESKMVSSGRSVADGPYAESKEAIGGYLIVLVDTLEEAVSIAKSNPTLEYGITIEVRPVLEDCPIFQRAAKQVSFQATA